MFGFDEQIVELGTGEAFLVVIGLAILLGLRHATDPDHLMAVSTLVASEEERSPHRAGLLGVAWGLGHATTLFLFGLPIVLLDEYLPARVEQAAEVLIGLLIIGLALRLLVRWRRDRLHLHVHEHDGRRHLHVHGHLAGLAHDVERPHDHAHPRMGTRSPVQAYGIGLVHGIGGSAGVGILLLTAIPSEAEGVVALVLFAIFTALSMAIVSSSFGFGLSRAPVMRRFAAVAPVLGVLSLAFGTWYALGALDAVPYYF